MVVIEPRRACSPFARVLQPSFFSYIGKGAVSVVVKKGAFRKAGHVEIREAIVVEVTDRHPHPVKNHMVNTGFSGDIFEFSAAKVAIQRITNRAHTFVVWRFSPVYQENVL